MNSIDHDFDCKTYQYFYDCLIAGPDGQVSEKNKETVLNNQKKVGFLRTPLTISTLHEKANST
jgi:hypothetical protein